MTDIGQSCIGTLTRPCLDQESYCTGRGCKRMLAEDGELLTPIEKETLSLLADIHANMMDIIGHMTNDFSDRAEMVSHIHNLQRMVMAQAACRRYPERYRLLGRK